MVAKKGSASGGSKLQNRMLVLLMLGWFIPLVVTTVVLLSQVVTRIGKQTERTIQTSMEKASEICSVHLKDCVRASKEASYIATIRDSWNEYKHDNDKSKLYSDVTLFLEEQYKFNPDFNLTVLAFTDEPDTVYYTGMKPLPADFRTDVMPQIQAEAKKLDTDMALINVQGNIYLIRNIMNRSIRPYAVIAMQLNNDSVFASLSSVWEYESYQVFCNEKSLTGGTVDNLEIPFESAGGSVSLARQDGKEFVVMPMKTEGFQMVYAVNYNGAAIRLEQRATIYVFMLVLIFMIPFIAVIIYFFNNRISRPIADLSDAAKEIAGGNYEIIVPEQENNGEINELTKNFNQMSRKLNEQFNKIFLEEIALRDANIHALQSQINPHFLNNTLEIINWQVRMDGDEKTSQMIEALSTMMSATLNREKKQIIPLSEELSYVNAYIYICSCRYGEKFQWAKNVQEGLRDYPVPRLIIQPIVENAAEHASDGTGRRMVEMDVSAHNVETGSVLTIRIANKGALSKVDADRIKTLLSDDENKEIQGSVSIGIHNVNRRLHIMYGEGSGLTIESSDDDHTVSIITIHDPEHCV